MKQYFQYRYVGLCLICLLYMSSLMAQVSVSATLDNNNLLIGDQVILRLRAIPLEGEVLKETDLSPLEKIEEIEVINVSSWDTLQSDRGIIFQQNITITSFDSGYYFIPQLGIQYEVNGELKESFTPQLALAVNTIAPDSLELAPIKDILEEPFALEDLIPLLGTILIFGLLSLMVYYFWKRRTQTDEAEEEEVIIKRPAHEIALERLAALREKQLWQQGEVKSYHSELTYIVREYLENRYGIQALESITDEILRDLAALGFDPSWKDKLREMLQAADLVKFAKAEPPVDFHDRMWEYADDFVRTSKKIEAEEPTEDESTTEEVA